jgi:hypothetical protein
MMALTVTAQNISSAFKTLGYSDKVSTKNPFFGMEGKHFYFYIPKESGSTDTRRKFLEKLSSELNQKKIGFSSFYDEKKSTSPKSSVGKIGFIGSSNAPAIVCKYFESSSQIDTNIKLKPANIVPSIVSDWITPEVMANNVRTYINKSNAPKPLIDQVNTLLDYSLNNEKSFIIDGEVSSVLVPAEFFEILTAIKMAVLLRNNDSDLKEVLNFTNKSKNIDYKFSKTSPLKINIPKASNYPLTDYEISFLPNNYKETLKVSVKSKVKSDSTNTLKLDQIFDNVGDVGRWFRSLTGSVKRQNFAQAQVAYAHLRFSTQSKRAPGAVTKKGAPKPKYSGKVKTGFPIDAVGHILQIQSLKLNNVILQRSKIWDNSTLKFRKPTESEIKMFGIVCRQVARNISRHEIKSQLDSLFTKKSESKMKSVTENLIISNNMVAGSPATPDLINLGKYCEKILEWASKESSPVKLYNFHEMFHKKVLEDRAICYAITDSERIKSGTTVKTKILFKYETMVNWDKMWIGLRKKDGDALGLDL